MGDHPRIEAPDMCNFITTKCRNNELWLVNNKDLTNASLGYLAKYIDRHEISPYAFAIEGNHMHLVADFPKMNRASFMRDFNSCVTRAVKRHVTEYPGGTLLKPYSNEFIPSADDIKEYFFYTVLQPVKDGLIEDIRKYPDYNCFWDAIYERRRVFEVVDWAQYNSDKRWKKEIKLKDYKYQVILKYERLPGFEQLSQKEYRKMMIKELDERQELIRSERIKDGKANFAGLDFLLSVKPGSQPHNPKVSNPDSQKPRILCSCKKLWSKCIKWYFKIYEEYKIASYEYRNGNHSISFPIGTYPPPLPCCS